MPGMTRAEHRTAREYDALASFYDRYFADRFAALRDGTYSLLAPLDEIRATVVPARMLGCAC